MGHFRIENIIMSLFLSLRLNLWLVSLRPLFWLHLINFHFLLFLVHLSHHSTSSWLTAFLLGDKHLVKVNLNWSFWINQLFFFHLNESLKGINIDVRVSVKHKLSYVLFLYSSSWSFIFLNIKILRKETFIRFSLKKFNIEKGSFSNFIITIWKTFLQKYKNTFS